MATNGLVQWESVKARGLDNHETYFTENRSAWKNIKRLEFHYSQLTTGSAVEIEQKTGTAISNIGKTELTLVGAFSADDNYYDNSYVFCVYIDSSNTEHYAYMATNTTSTTEVAFTEYASGDNGVSIGTLGSAVTDFYATVSINIYTDINRGTALATQAGETFGMGSTGALIQGVVAAEASATVAAGILGVGAVYGRYHTNHNNYDGAVQHMEYVTPWGEVKWAHCTTNTTDSTTEVIFYQGTYAGDYTVTAGTVVVNDFYRKRWIRTTYDPDAGHTWLLTDANCGNVDGSGNDVWAMIEEGYYTSVHSRYHCPKQHKAILHRINMFGPASATNFAIIAVTYTPEGFSKPVIRNLTMSGTTFVPEIEFDMEPGTDLSMTIIDGAAAFTADVFYNIIEAEEFEASY